MGTPIHKHFFFLLGPGISGFFWLIFFSTPCIKYISDTPTVCFSLRSCILTVKFIKTVGSTHHFAVDNPSPQLTVTQTRLARKTMDRLGFVHTRPRPSVERLTIEHLTIDRGGALIPSEQVRKCLIRYICDTLAL